MVSLSRESEEGMWYVSAVICRAIPRLPPQLYAASACLTPLMTVCSGQLGKAAKRVDPRARRPAIAFRSRTGRGAPPPSPPPGGRKPSWLRMGPFVDSRVFGTPRHFRGCAMRVTMNDAQGPVSVLVCVACRADARAASGSRPGAKLVDAMIAALSGASDVRIREVLCLGNCSRGITAAIHRGAGWTYVYGDLDATRDGPALIAGARLLAGAPDGLMPWIGRPEALKRGLIARVPPPDGEAQSRDRISALESKRRARS